ncbi:MAG TPA: cytochrome c [Bryobacteraceae bacterium]|nr:cytochrome c [Bryobacteraceae bacterium]
MRTISSVAMFAPLLLLATSCRQDMQDQPKYKPLGANSFFADGRDARPIPAGTIARDELNDTDFFHTGEANGAFLNSIPLKVDANLLRRGQDRFNIYCSPCHGRTGDGNGMVAQRGVKIPANLHTDRLRSVPPGYIYQVIKNGYGAMGDYGDQVPVNDRWAIVAYIRALQLSREATMNDVPADQRTQLSGEPQPQPGAPR